MTVREAGRALLRDFVICALVLVAVREACVFACYLGGVKFGG